MTVRVTELVKQYQLAQMSETKRTLLYLIVQSLSKRNRKVFDFIDDAGWCTSRQIASSLRISIHNASNRVRYLRNCGLVTVEITDDNTKFLYSIYHG